MTVRIAESAREQNRATTEINQMVGNIGETAKAVASSSHQVHEAAGQVARISDQLTGEVTRFQT